MASTLPNLPITLPPNTSNPNPSFSLLSLRNTLHEAKQLHALLIKSAHISHPFAAARLAEFYAVSDHGSLHLAHRIVTSSPHPNTFAYNALIRGHLKTLNPQMAIDVYLQMLRNSAQADQFTFTLILKACAHSRNLALARQLLSQIVRQGFVQNRFLINKLIHVFAVSGSISDARKLFDKSPDRDIITWNSMLEGYAEIGDAESVYKVFDEMPVRDVVSWNTLISFHIDSGEFTVAVEQFRRMEKEEGRIINNVTFITILTAIAHLGALDLGHYIHSRILQSSIDLDENLGSALINMYAKCGLINGAIKTFSTIKKKSADVFNALLSGLAVNGESSKALTYFSEMLASNFKPNAITFSAILNACSHGGNVEDGIRLFNDMERQYRIVPGVVHYGCMVDLFCRAGLFDKVEEIMKEMPVEADAVMWKAVLSASRVHGNLDLVRKAEPRVFELARDDSAVCVLLSNAYAANGESSRAHEIRKWLRRGRGESMYDSRGLSDNTTFLAEAYIIDSPPRGGKMVKQPGCSAIEVDGVVHEFLAGDLSHSRKDEIYAMLREMLRRLKGLGYEPDEEQVLLDVDEGDDKCVSLVYHSEKLAVAYGLIGTSKGATIRVVKNLRICGDCHAAFKLLSAIYDRTIVVRDSNRFHHFSEGSCSCKDYW